MGFLAGKRILITGLLSKHSIAYGIAKACHREGATLAFTYQNERFQERVAKFAEEFGSQLILPCDVSVDAEIDTLSDAVLDEFSAIDPAPGQGLSPLAGIDPSHSIRRRPPHETPLDRRAAATL